MTPNTLLAQLPPHIQHQLASMTKERLQQIVSRMQLLRSHGHNEQSNPEFAACPDSQDVPVSSAIADAAVGSLSGHEIISVPSAATECFASTTIDTNATFVNNTCGTTQRA